MNGLDVLPSLQEKHLWNESKFNEARKDFVNSHNELVEVIEKVIVELKNTGSGKFEYQLSKADFLEQINSGKVVFEDIDLANVDLSNENLIGITFKNCFLSVDFRNCNLSNTKFITGNIKTSDFRNANLSNALMKNVSFEGTKFKGAKTKGFVFTDNYCYSEEAIGQTEFYDWIIETE